LRSGRELTILWLLSLRVHSLWRIHHEGTCETRSQLRVSEGMCMAKWHITLDEAKGNHGKIVLFFRKMVRQWTQDQLAIAMGVSTRWIQELESMPLIQSQETRKALAETLDIPVALLDLEESEKAFIGEQTPLELWIVESLEHETRSRWQLYYTSSYAITEKGHLEQIENLEQLADNHSRYQDRILRLLAQNYQLAGSLARDHFLYSIAKKYFLESLRLAQEAKSIDLAAVAAERHAVALLRQERIAEALAMYQEAADIGLRAQPYIRAYVKAGLAEALARNGRKDECCRTLDEAQGLLNRSYSIALEEDYVHIRFTKQSLEATWGECHVLFGEPSKGLDYLQTALRTLDPTMNRRRCSVLMQQAEAHRAANQLDYCVQYALEGLQVAKALKSKEDVNWAYEIYSKLQGSKWKNEPVVKQLKIAIID
jgi:transcriptional regulator with XRE-family HTH domain